MDRSHPFWQACKSHACDTRTHPSHETHSHVPNPDTPPQVSEGNVLVADLLRLSAALPPALAGGASPSAPVLFDFRYLKDPEAHERRVEADRQLAALDDRFREARMVVLPHHLRIIAASSSTTGPTHPSLHEPLTYL